MGTSFRCTWEASESVTQILESRLGNQEIGGKRFGKEASAGEIMSCTSTSLWGGVACVLDDCGLLYEYGDTLKTLYGLVYLFEDPMCIGREGK